MQSQVAVSDAAVLDDQQGADESAYRVHPITDEVAYVRTTISNVVFIGRPGTHGDWVLIDAGVTGSAHRIERAARERFGDQPPRAIILTHGHFDHIGALRRLIRLWNVPVFAHTAEHPYLNGTASYPPPDPRVGGGLMAWLAPLYPRGPIQIGRWLEPLPLDGSVPHLPGWTWIHTPGHTKGHVSLWREIDRTLISGDAFITTRQESAYAVLVQRPEMHGPPMYYTENWQVAGESVQRLAALEPDVVIAGHGRPLHGPQMREALHRLAAEFEQVAVPRNHQRQAVEVSA